MQHQELDCEVEQQTRTETVMKTVRGRNVAIKGLSTAENFIVTRKETLEQHPISVHTKINLTGKYKKKICRYQKHRTGAVSFTIKYELGGHPIMKETGHPLGDQLEHQPSKSRTP